MHLPTAVLRTLIVVAVISVHFLAARVRRRREEARARRSGKFPCRRPQRAWPPGSRSPRN